MATRNREQDRVRAWQTRVKLSNDVYDTWEQAFECRHLVDYYRGKQWRGVADADAKDRYVINLVFPTIETQLPTLLFYRPQVKVEPRPGRADDLGGMAGARAELAQQTLQTLIDQPSLAFSTHTWLALRNAYFRFGVIEVGYTADWIDNPHAGKPLLKDEAELKDAGGEVVRQPAKVPAKESLYLKSIPPQQFRVSVSGKNLLDEHDWISYWEWHYLEDVKRNKAYSHTANLQAGGQLRDMPQPVGDDSAEGKAKAGMVKLWKIWDLRTKEKHVLADGHDKFLQEAVPFTRHPFAVLKFYELPDDFYPLPPVYNWLSPQDEINETREARRTHRKRFTRRYTYRDGTIELAELEKLEAGGDGVYARHTGAPGETPLQPVPDAPLGGDYDKALAESKEDFILISGVGAEARGVAESETATQANIVDVRQRIRESRGRVIVSEWLADICTLMLHCLREKTQLPFWVNVNTDPFGPGALQEQLKIQAGWQQITAQELGDSELDISVEVSSLSPASEDLERQAWNQVLALLTNPALLMLLMQSEPLLRKTLAYYGLKRESEVKEIQRVGQQMLMMQMAAQMNAQGAAAGGGGGEGAGTMPTPAQQPAGVPAAGPVLQ